MFHYLWSLYSNAEFYGCNLHFAVVHVILGVEPIVIYQGTIYYKTLQYTETFEAEKNPSHFIDLDQTQGFDLSLGSIKCEGSLQSAAIFANTTRSNRKSINFFFIAFYVFYSD